MAQMYKPYMYVLGENASKVLRQRFEQNEPEGTGYMNYIDAAELFKYQVTVSLDTTKLLFRVFERTQLNFEELQQVFAFLLCCQAAFTKFGKGEISRDETVQALGDLFLNIGKDVVARLVAKFSMNGAVSELQFYQICAVCVLSRKVFADWDNQEKGSIEIGMEHIIELSCVFM